MMPLRFILTMTEHLCYHTAKHHLNFQLLYSSFVKQTRPQNFKVVNVRQPLHYLQAGCLTTDKVSG